MNSADMLVRHLTVGGLRSYPPEPVHVELAPLTLVFGPNSAGKSSLLSVLPLLQQTAVRPEVLSMSGDMVQGGTFRMAIHQHDETLPMTLGFGWTAPDGSLHSGSGEFRWDPQRRAAVRTRMDVFDGSTRAHVTGPRPWAGQSGAEIARQLGPEFFEVLSHIYFLGPMRARPERTTIVGQGDEHYVGPAGERMAALLSEHPHLVAEVNAWCDALGLGYRVRMLTPVSQDIIKSAGDFTVLALEDVRFDPPVLVSPTAVGFGVGQLLPVITQCVLSAGALILIEQPEVHLHPRLQASVADLFIDTVNSGRAQLLIETHSEHLVLRTLRRVREGRLDPQDLAILYVDMHEDGAAFVRRLEVNHSGEFGAWVAGFLLRRAARRGATRFGRTVTEVRGHSVFGVGIGDSALDDQSQDPALHRALHEELLEDLAVHGQLIFNSEAELRSFVSAVALLPPTLAKAWETVLSSRRVSVSVSDPESEPGLSQLLDADELERRFAPQVCLVLLDADQAELLGVPRDEFSSRTPGGLVEIGRISTATRTATILAAHQIMEAPLRDGDNREDEWADRIGPLVASTSAVTIYDKYVGMQTARRYIYDYEHGDGLTWLLSRMSMTPGRRLRIITSVPYVKPGRTEREPVDEQVLAAAFLLLKEHVGRDVGLDLVLVPERQRIDSTVERFGHDRHIRFGERAALALGMGVQTFEAPRFRETITVARLPISDAKEREERAMRAAIRPPREGWLGWARSLQVPPP